MVPHPNAARGLKEWHRRRPVRDLHEQGADPLTISRRLSRPLPIVLADLAALRLEPHPPIGERLLALLDVFGTLTTSRLLDLCPLPHSRQHAAERVHRSLRRLAAAGVIRCFASAVGRRECHWILTSRLPMTLDDAKAYVLSGLKFGDVYPLLDEADQEPLRQWFLHTPGLPVNPVQAVARTGVAKPAGAVAQARASGFTGDSCQKCGSFSMVRSGACLRCEECGETSGCG